MKKLFAITFLLCFSITTSAVTTPIKKKNKTIFVEFNFLAKNLGLKYDNLKFLGKNSCINYSIGLNTIYKKTNYIVPPNIGIPIEFNYLIGNRKAFVELGLTLTPQLIMSKDYTHYNKDNFEFKIEENTSLFYITPHLGFRTNINNIVNFKINFGPRIKTTKSKDEYIDRIFENKKYLELFYFQMSLGFPI